MFMQEKNLVIMLEISRESGYLLPDGRNTADSSRFK